MKTTDKLPGEVTLESGKYFSESMIWDLQKKFYCESGIDAWLDVPSEVTSNPYIANAYAKIIVAFIRDIIAKDPAAIQHPFYIMELGAGTGKFAFYANKRIQELLAQAGLEKIKIRYIICDIVEKNIEFLKWHPKLKTYIETGIIDFAMFELESSAPIKLQIANMELSSELLINPLIAIANYVFDTATNEAFNITNHQIRRLLVDIVTTDENMENGQVKSIEKISVLLRPSEQVGVHYEDDTINQIMETYRTQVKSSTNFLMPNGAFAAIAQLKKLANNRLLVVSTDKGYTSLEGMSNLYPPRIISHGATCFSMSVNYHALKLYFEKNGGDACIEPTIDTVLNTAAFIFGYQFSDLRETRAALDHYINGFSPSKYNKLSWQLRESFANFDFESIVCFLVLSEFDPNVFTLVSDRLISLYPKASNEATSFLENKMTTLAENYFYLPFQDKSLFNIAYFCQFCGMTKDAIHYFKQVLANINHHQKNTNLTYYIHYNLGLCYKNEKNYVEAVANFKQALKLKPECIDSKDMLNRLSCMVV